MEQLDEIIFNAIVSLRNNQKELNENTQVTMEKLKERLTFLLGKEKLLNKYHGENNSYFEMTTCPLKPTQLPKTPIINKKNKT